MSQKQPSSAELKSFFKANKLGKSEDLLSLLNTKSRMTVFRKLQKLNYLSSYTHSGSYYTLNNIPDFDSSDLWYFKEVGFSKFGNLKNTIHHLVEQSDSGFTHAELEKKLHIRVHNTLLDLVKENKITRTVMDGGYVYFSSEKLHYKEQITKRRNNSYKLIYSGLSDGLIIEILASIIRVTKSEKIEPLKAVLDLTKKGVVVTEEQVETVLRQFDLKKTVG